MLQLARLWFGVLMGGVLNSWGAFCSMIVPVTMIMPSACTSCNIFTATDLCLDLNVDLEPAGKSSFSSYVQKKK